MITSKNLNIKINSGNELYGQIQIPPSKSISHRALICAYLAGCPENISNLGESLDITATQNGLVTLLSDNKEKYIECNESGSTLRFLMPLSAVFDTPITLTGAKRLGERPITAYFENFDKHNVSYTCGKKGFPFTIKGPMNSGKFYLPGNVSSQYISGLLFALPLLEGDSEIFITTNVESTPYIELTISVLKDFGIKIAHKDFKYFYINGNQKYMKTEYTVEGDFSQAAFYVVAGLIGNGLTLTGLNPFSLQGDKVILDIVKSMGGNVLVDGNKVIVNKSICSGITIDVSNCPDLVPPLAILGSLSNGVTKLVNASRLKIKESDRLEAMCSVLTELGADIKEEEDSLIILGKPNLNGGNCDCHNDHRIAMAVAIASIKCTAPIYLSGADSVNKSYPNFWDDFTKLGGKLDE